MHGINVSSDQILWKWANIQAHAIITYSNSFKSHCFTLSLPPAPPLLLLFLCLSLSNNWTPLHMEACLIYSPHAFVDVQTQAPGTHTHKKNHTNHLRSLHWRMTQRRRNTEYELVRRYEYKYEITVWRMCSLVCIDVWWVVWMGWFGGIGVV